MEQFSNLNNIMYNCVYIKYILNQPVSICMQIPERKRKRKHIIFFDSIIIWLNKRFKQQRYTSFCNLFKCEGMETDFMFNGIRPERVTLAQSRGSKNLWSVNKYYPEWYICSTKLSNTKYSLCISLTCRIQVN